MLTIPAEYRKGGLVDRSYPLAQQTIELLEAIPRSKPGPFTWPVDRATLYNRLNALLLRAGLPHDRGSKFHRLRRTTASHYKAAGGDAQWLLGHASAADTATYIDPRIVRQPSPPDLLFRPGA